jgi:hypothetical protein
MATKVSLRGSELHAVYSDQWRPIYEAVGTLVVKRESEVEFNHATGEWEAIHLASNTIIARGQNRKEVIRLEVEWLEQREIR